MPLGDPMDVSGNIAKLRHEGKPMAQAIAIAMHLKKEHEAKKKVGKVFANEESSKLKAHGKERARSESPSKKMEKMSVKEERKEHSANGAAAKPKEKKRSGKKHKEMAHRMSAYKHMEKEMKHKQKASEHPERKEHHMQKEKHHAAKKQKHEQKGGLPSSPTQASASY